MLLGRAQAVVGAPMVDIPRPRPVKHPVANASAAAPQRSTNVVGMSPAAREDHGQGGTSVQARISHEVVHTIKDLYGRGPTHAKTYLCDDYVFCVMSGGLTRDEETMIRGGQQDAVRDYRLRFQSVIAPELIRRVEDVLARKVASYHSQVLFDPDRLIEIFVLDPAEEQLPTPSPESPDQ
jgi:uncharacterized protein YbcI